MEAPRDEVLLSRDPAELRAELRPPSLRLSAPSTIGRVLHKTWAPCGSETQSGTLAHEPGEGLEFIAIDA